MNGRLSPRTLPYTERRHLQREFQWFWKFQRDHPWNGAVHLQLQLPAEQTFAIRLRLPAWARAHAVSAQRLARIALVDSLHTRGSPHSRQIIDLTSQAVTVLRGTVRQLQPDGSEQSLLATFLAYAAWGNRGTSEMRIWFGAHRAAWPDFLHSQFRFAR
jgi:hypothetical protein